MASNNLGLQAIFLDGSTWCQVPQAHVDVFFDAYDFTSGSWDYEESPERGCAGRQASPSLGSHFEPCKLDLNQP